MRLSDVKGKSRFSSLGVKVSFAAVLLPILLLTTGCVRRRHPPVPAPFTDCLDTNTCVVPVPPPPPPQNPPTMACVVNPTTITLGESATIHCEAASSDNRPLSVQFVASSGRVTPKGLDGVFESEAPGVANITVTVTDDRGLTNITPISVVVTAPPAPQPAKNNEIRFQTRNRSLSNLAKAQLGDVVLRLQRDRAAKLAIVGRALDSEPNSLALSRTLAVRNYIVSVDSTLASRIEMTHPASPGSAATVELWVVPEGASVEGLGSSFGMSGETGIRPPASHPAPVEECKGLLIFQMPATIDLTELIRKEEVFKAFVARTLQTGLGKVLRDLKVCTGGDCGDIIRDLCHREETPKTTGDSNLLIWPVDATRYVKATLNGKMDFRTTPPDEDSDITHDPKMWIWDATPQDDIGDLRLRLEGRNDSKVPPHDIGVKVIKPNVKKNDMGVTRTWFSRINEFLQTPIGEKIVLYSIIGLVTAGGGWIVSLIRGKVKPVQDPTVMRTVIEKIFFIPSPPSPREPGGSPPQKVDEEAEREHDGGKWVN